MRPRSFSALLTLTFCSALALGCGPRQPAEPPASAEPEPAPAPAPKVKEFPSPPHGALEPIDAKEVREVLATQYSVERGIETWLFVVRYDELPEGAWLRWDQGRVHVQGEGTEGLLAVIDQGPAPNAPSDGDGFRIWVRRREKTPRSPGPLLADVYLPAYKSRAQVVPGQRIRFQLSPKGEAPQTPGLEATYLKALSISGEEGDPVAWLLASDAAAPARATERRELPDDFGAELMRAASGYDSLEDALQTQVVLRRARAKEPATIRIKDLEGPRLATHPWAEMIRKLPGRAAPEPMAAFIPADFYYLRAKDYSSLERFLEHSDTFGTPALSALSSSGKLLDLAQTYRTELGIPASEWTRIFGPRLILELALVGSDPFLRTGSDLTLVLRVNSRPLFLTALEAPRSALQSELTRGTARYGNYEIEIYQSADGRVRQHIAHGVVDGAELVAISNSRRALELTLDTWTKKSASLAAEPDFAYMLARDADVEGELLFFAGDRFIARSMSPAQRILDARRHLAHADLLRVSYGELLYRGVFGRAPTSADELFKAPWLGAEYRTHVTGEKLEFAPDRAPRSTFGSPARLSSLLDLPPIERVTASEKSAYEQLARDYEAIWGTRIDPIALRATTRDSSLEFHLRVLPVSQAGSYEDIERWSGGGTTRRKTPLSGLGASLAIGPTSPLRRALASQSQGMLGLNLNLDWLGEFIEVGLMDGPEILRLALEAPEVPRPPGSPAPEEKGDLERLGDLPLYLTLDLKSAGGATIFLATLRKLASDAAPGAVEWGEFAKVGKTVVVQIKTHDLALYYALTDKQLHVALSSETLEKLLERGDSPSEATSTDLTRTGAASKQLGGELNVDLLPSPSKSGLFLALAWLLEAARYEQGLSDPKAELLLTVHPELGAGGSAYFEKSRELLGYVPVSPDGAPLELGPEGLKDPLRGSRYRPVWPEAPAKNGPLARVVELLRAARLEVGTDLEPGNEPERSLRSRVRIELTPTTPRAQD